MYVDRSDGPPETQGSSLTRALVNNYSLKWMWLMVDIYLKKRRGKNPPLATDFSIYLNSEVIQH